jgi:hypothetical protein
MVIIAVDGIRISNYNVKSGALYHSAPLLQQQHPVIENLLKDMIPFSIVRLDTEV